TLGYLSLDSVHVSTSFLVDIMLLVATTRYKMSSLAAYAHFSYRGPLGGTRAGIRVKFGTRRSSRRRVCGRLSSEASGARGRRTLGVSAWSLHRWFRERRRPALVGFADVRRPFG